MSYILAVIRALKSIKNLDVNIKLDSEDIFGKFLLLTIGNGKTSGGGFFLNPDADPTDDILNITSVDSGSRFDVIKNLPYALVNKLQKVKKAKFFLSREIQIKLKEPYYVHLDGEIGSQAAVEFNIFLTDKKLKTIQSK